MTELTANTWGALDMNNHNSEIPVQKIMLDIYILMKFFQRFLMSK